MVRASDGHVIHYEYDSYGCLARWIDGAKKKESYGYDTHYRFTERRDVEGRVIGRNIYDDFGCRVSDTDTVIASSGNTVRCLMDKGRLMQVRDERGSYVFHIDTISIIIFPS